MFCIQLLRFFMRQRNCSSELKKVSPAFVPVADLWFPNYGFVALIFQLKEIARQTESKILVSPSLHLALVLGLANKRSRLASLPVYEFSSLGNTNAPLFKTSSFGDFAGPSWLSRTTENVFKTDRIDSYVPRPVFGGVIILSRAHQNILPMELDTDKSTPVNLRFSWIIGSALWLAGIRLCLSMLIVAPGHVKSRPRVSNKQRQNAQCERVFFSERQRYQCERPLILSVWYEFVECELPILFRRRAKDFLFYSTFESETGLFVKPFVMRFCLCAFLENSTRGKFLSWPSHSLMAGKYANQFEWKNRLHFTDPWPVLLLSTTRRRSLHRSFRLRVSDCASPNFVAGVLTGVRWLLFRSSKNFLCKAHVFLPAGLQCEGGFANKHRKFIAECKLAWGCSSDTWRKSHASRVTPVS